MFAYESEVLNFLNDWLVWILLCLWLCAYEIGKRGK